MQHRKSHLSILAIILAGALLVPISFPRAHADDQTLSLTITGTLAKGTSDSFLGGGYYDIIQAGNTLNFNVFFTANYVVFQRNLTLGVKMDWMQNYLNTSSYTAVFASQSIEITLAVPIPELTGQYSNLNQAGHSWTLELWDMPVGSTWTTSCNDYGYYKGPACNSWQSFTYSTQTPPIAVYNSAQVGFYNNMLQAGAIITGISGVLGGKTPPAGSSAAVAELAQANAQAYLAENAYRNGDFNTAQTDSQNALNYANAAQSSLQTIGGGTDAAAMTNIWLTGVAVIMGGVGALLLGFGGFKYLRGKTRSIPGYSPSTSKP